MSRALRVTLGIFAGLGLLVLASSFFVSRTLNEWLKEFSRKDGDVYLDYYDSLTDAEGGMKPGLSFDGVHPTAKGYAIMAPLAEKAIAEALQR